MRHRMAITAVLATIAVLLASAGVAAGYATAPGYVAHDYVTGFPESAQNHWGPLGIAFDQSSNLYVADTVDGNIYRFQPGGGVASSATRLTSSPIPGAITGLAFSRSGQLYLGRFKLGDVVQVDPASGQIIRTIASVRCATGLAIDPVSGDLFVSQNLCGNTIWRVSLSGSSVGTVTRYATAPAVDGVAFDKDGDLYAESDGTLMKIDGTARPTPGVVKSIAKVPGADGVAFGTHASGSPPFVVTNRNDGIVTRVDLTKTPPTQSDIFTGGSRGDFAAVDSSGCLFITQSSSIVRISGKGNSCAFEPTTPGTTPGVTITVLGSPPTSCAGIGSLKFRIRQARTFSSSVSEDLYQWQSRKEAAWARGHCAYHPSTPTEVVVHAQGRRHDEAREEAEERPPLHPELRMYKNQTPHPARTAARQSDRPRRRLRQRAPRQGRARPQHQENRAQASPGRPVHRQARCRKCPWQA